MPSKKLIFGTALAFLAVISVYLLAHRWLDRSHDYPVSEYSMKLARSEKPIARGLAMFLGKDEGAKHRSGGTGRKSGQKLPYPLLTAASTDRQYPYQTYDENGRPNGLMTAPFSPPENARVVGVSGVPELRWALLRAGPGDIISLAAGEYSLDEKTLSLLQPGSRTAPIYVRSSRLGTVTINVKRPEGFRIKAPFWVFENLVIRGECVQSRPCEHAIHLVGGASSFVLRNSVIVNFNAHIKANGLETNGKTLWPDFGLLEYNNFHNDEARNTESPVVFLNLDSVSDWVVRGNFIADFAKTGGNRISYGAYMKGNGKRGLFERNLVACEHNLWPDKGIRIGLSFGGGGMKGPLCRDNDCSTEHTGGIIRNNIVMNCSTDVGIYLNRAWSTEIYNNLLHNTLGIDVRYSRSSATITNNLIAGRVRERDDGNAIQSNNLVDGDCFGYKRTRCLFDKLFANPDNANFLLMKTVDPTYLYGVEHSGLSDDICGNLREGNIYIGPIQYSKGLECLHSGANR